MSNTADSSSQKIGHGFGCVTKAALLVLVLFFLFMFMAGGIVSGQISALVALCFGWLTFLNRTVPQITWNWDLVGMAVICSALIAVLGHRFAVWITTSIVSKRGTAWRWPWRWTLCGFAAVGLLFLVGMSVGGAAHQFGWLIGSQEPWFEQKPRYLEDLLQMQELDMECRVALIDTNTVAGVHQSLRKSDAERRSEEHRKRSMLQSFHILLVSTNRERVDGIIIFPRAAEFRSRLHGYFITGADSVQVHTEKLPALLKEREPHLIAF